MAIARHSYIQKSDIHFEFQSIISPRADVENFDIWSDLNMLDLNEMFGDNRFVRGQTVYVHMSKGPGNIAYPFAVTRYKPDSINRSIFMIKGKVSGIEAGQLLVRYNFEKFLPSSDLKSLVRTTRVQQGKTMIAINDQGVARLVSVSISGETYAYR